MKVAMISKLAASARVKFGLSLTEPVDVTKVLMKSRISRLKRPLQGAISGLFLRADSTKVILINSARSLGHQNFTMAHELYHALYDESTESKVCTAGKWDTKNKAERIADDFASHFLMPEAGIFENLTLRGALNSPEINDIIYLEQLYNVSHAAMLYRLSTLRLISKNQAEDLKHGIKALARQLGYPLDLYEPTFEEVVISDYAEKAKIAYDKGLITSSRYRELLAEINISMPDSYVEDAEHAD